MAPPIIEIQGYAIVTDDDRIAGADGATPRALRNDADWDYFQRGLGEADVVALGRLGHEANPNVRRRRRLIVSRSVRGIEARGGEHWWNPRGMRWDEAAALLLPTGGRVAVPGGQGVFDLFLGVGYAAFHLSRARGTKAPGGRALFSACDTGSSAEDVLRGAGLKADEETLLDAAANVTLTVWRKT